ncbi:MAG: formate--tetrahydrofolate ligase [Defluviitaleaceae bacterium]|nr:formate--tetrahydrofolate ligase [Defluviitaleaceae bacterium]
MFKSDLEIAQATTLLPIIEIGRHLGIEDKIEQYGHYKAKISLDVMKSPHPNGKLILVTAISPTKAGEGKTTTTVGLGQGLTHIGKKAVIALREPSLGPVMGIKGGAAGGGLSQVLPMEDLNLHFTGDIHAITTANNAICALVDNHIYQGNELGIDPERVVFKRCLDMNDRALREVTIGQGPKTNGVERKDGFNITVASEIMAVFCLAKDYDDLRHRIQRIIVAYTKEGKPVTVCDLKIEGSIVMLLAEAIKPNLVQTVEHTPVIVHGGPFANIAHGCNSVIATQTALKLADYVVTEAGFGADLGAEKFFNIKCREAGLTPDAVVIVATIRALKMHGGVNENELKDENVEALVKGVDNLAKHIESVTQFGVPYVVAINHFIHDTTAEVEFLLNWCQENGHPVCLSKGWAEGGAGVSDLARQVVKLIDEKKANFKPIYERNESFEEKVEKIAKQVYGARGVVYTNEAKATLNELRDLGYGDLLVCMAKTPASLTDDPTRMGRPTDFDITINEVRISAGAGFIVLLAGGVMTMPGLPKQPSALKMDLTADGAYVGLF